MLIDLSHEIRDGVVTFKGHPPLKITNYLDWESSRGRYAEGVGFHIARMEMVSNTGTYTDSPFHRYEDGRDIATLPLEMTTDLDAVVIPVSERAITPDHIRETEVRERAVLFHTGWDEKFGREEYFVDNPFITESCVAALVEGGAVLVGIDSSNVDDMADLRRPAHSGLLRAGIPIVEHLTNLDQLPRTGARFFATPLRIRGVGTSPVRAFAIA